MIPVFLADGFEEIEALATVDILRRAGVEVITVGVGSKMPVGAHGIAVCADITENELNLETLEGVILPGGMPGTTNLEASTVVQNAVAYAAQHGLMLAAICAAPSILGHCGLLKGKDATCYPGFEEELSGAILVEEGVVVDDNVITAAAAGYAIDFALTLVSYLQSVEAAASVVDAIEPIENYD